jgi:hypothetical protein
MYFIPIYAFTALCCGLVGVRFSLTGRESRVECWNYIAVPTRTIKSRGAKSHNEWAPLSVLQRAARFAWSGRFEHSAQAVMFCGVKQNGAPGQNHTKRLILILTYTGPLLLLLYAYIRPWNPLTVKSATSRTVASKQMHYQGSKTSKSMLNIPKEKRAIWKWNCGICKMSSWRACVQCIVEGGVNVTSALSWRS